MFNDGVMCDMIVALLEFQVGVMSDCIFDLCVDFVCAVICMPLLKLRVC